MPLLPAPEKQIGLGTSMTLSDPCEEAASVGTPFVMPHYFLDVRYWHSSGHALLHCTCPLLTQSGHHGGRGTLVPGACT